MGQYEDISEICDRYGRWWMVSMLVEGVCTAIAPPQLGDSIGVYT